MKWRLEVIERKLTDKKFEKSAFVSATNYAFKYFLAQYIDKLAEEYEITLISNDEYGVPEIRHNVNVHHLAMERKPKIVTDLMCLLKLVLYMRRIKFDVIYTISPKGGLIGIVAGWLSGVPNRIHFFTGQVWVTQVGIRRFIYRMTDKIIAKRSTGTLIDSPSQLEFLEAENVIKPGAGAVLGKGSVSGVDILRFRRNEDARKKVRIDLGISQDVSVLLFVGRLNREKGVLDLANVFVDIVAKYPETILLFVGPDEGMKQHIENVFRSPDLTGSVFFVGETKTPELYYNASDVLCLPSYREGFGSVVLEAACAGTPAVVSRIYGLSDTVVENETGLLHVPGNLTDMFEKICAMLESPKYRSELGTAAATRVKEHFSTDYMVNEFWHFHCATTSVNCGA